MSSSKSLFLLLILFVLSGCSSVLNTSQTSQNSQQESDSLATNIAAVWPDSSSDALGLDSGTSLEPPADLWDRIRKGFSLSDLDTPLVTEQEQWYSARPDYILRMTERSRRYLFHIVEELEKRNMPMELALLPYIESAFNPHAISSAKAAGIWQFMPATGSYFELKQDILRDDRHDVLASTRAALDYLEKLHAMFGDWHLALAAYNWGEGNLKRSIKRNESAGQSTNYTALQMPSETRSYVPKLQAVKNLVLNPANFSVELPTIEDHPFFQVVNITQDMDATLVANLANVDMSDFRALNPSLKKPVVFAAATPQILLPWNNAQVFRRNLSELGKGRLASWTVWHTPKTMSVSDAAKQVGMSEAALRDANNIPPRMLIKGGSALMVPRTAQAGQEDVAADVAASALLSLAPERSASSGGGTTRSIRVRSGQTLSGIAKAHGVRASDLASWNKLSLKSQLKVGQVLQLRSSSAPSVAATKSTKKKTRKVQPKVKPAARKRRS